MRDDNALLNRRLARIAVSLGERDVDGQDERFMNAVYRVNQSPGIWEAVRSWDGMVDPAEPRAKLFGHWALSTARFTEMLVWPQSVINALTFFHRGLEPHEGMMPLAVVVVKSWEDEYGPLGDLRDATSYAWNDIDAALRN